MGLEDNAEWQEWLTARPPAIRQLALKYPPDKPYRVQGGAFPGWIYCYEECEDGTVGFKVDIESPFPRRVFGLKPEHLELWPDE